jgi:hypothetical protein
VISEGSAAREVGNIFNVSWPHDALIKDTNIHEQLVERDVLLRVCANEIVILKASNREHRLVVELRVVKSIQKVNPPWPGGRETDTQFARELGITAGHERSSLFMANLDKADLVFMRAQGFHDAVDSVARKAKNNFYAPIQ